MKSKIPGSSREYLENRAMIEEILEAMIETYTKGKQAVYNPYLLFNSQ